MKAECGKASASPVSQRAYSKWLPLAESGPSALDSGNAIMIRSFLTARGDRFRLTTDVAGADSYAASALGEVAFHKSTRRATRWLQRTARSVVELIPVPTQVTFLGHSATPNAACPPALSRR